MVRNGRRGVGNSGSVDTAGEEVPRQETENTMPKKKILLHILENEEGIRYDRIQEARGRIARRYYDQDDVRKQITRALLTLFGY